MSLESEAIAKGKALLDRQYGGDPMVAFKHYDKNDDNCIGKAEIIAFLSDAGIGSRWTHNLIANGVISTLDTDRDGLLSLDELKAAALKYQHELIAEARGHCS